MSRVFCINASGEVSSQIAQTGRRIVVDVVEPRGARRHARASEREHVCSASIISGNFLYYAYAQVPTVYYGMSHSTAMSDRCRRPAVRAIVLSAPSPAGVLRAC